MTIAALVTSFHKQFTAAAETLQHPLLLLIRLYWGYDFFQTGMGKLNNLERTAEFFLSLGIPFPHLNAIAAGSTEIACGLLLVAGLGTRYAAVPLIVIMGMAYATDDYEALSNIVTDVESFVGATPFQHLLASMVLLAWGPGYFSADTIVAKFFRSRRLP